MMVNKDRTMLIIGNGPSTKELAKFGFENIPRHIDTFGMGLAFKYFSKINWWPTYYICADQKVVKHNKKFFQDIILDSKITTDRFFLPIPVVESSRLEVIQHGSTGDFAFRKAVEFNYGQIYIIGIDLDYKPLKEATRITREEFNELGLKEDYDTTVIYKVREPIKDHPNYFFSEYQEVGDIYSEPRGNSWHLLSWQRARELAEQKSIPVRNLGRDSKLVLFEHAPLIEALTRKEKYSVKLPSRKASSLASDVYRAERALADTYLRQYADLKKERDSLARQIAAPNRVEYDESLSELANQIARSNESNCGNQLDISVIVPCYNGADFIKPFLESLAQQTLPQNRFEVICIDDCSTDQTADVISSYDGKIKNLKLIKHLENKKQGGARNTGIEKARGKFVLFVDSDDFLRLDALEVLINSTTEKTDIIVGQLLKVRYDKPYRSQPTNRRMEGDIAKSTFMNRLGWFPVGMLISRDLLKKNSIRFNEGVFFEDIQFCTEVFLRSKECKIIPDQLYMYIQRDNSTVNSMSEKKLKDSALAMSINFKMAQKFPNGLETFKETAVGWLRLQASRVRDGGAKLSERKALGQFFAAQLRSHGLDAYLNAGELEELEKIAAGTPKSPPAPTAVGDITSSSPWGGKLEADFAGKVIFFCEVDYHIRTAAPVARALRRMGISSIIVDAAKSTSFTTNRPLPENERHLYADLDLREFNVQKALPFSTDAAAFVFMNDLTYTKRLILENFGFGVPTFGFYEGINDDWNLDRKLPRRPYRSVNYLLLPGIYQQGFYQDRECRVVGLPNVRSRLAKPFVAPRVRRAIINVNFTYGVLEDRRDDYVTTAVQACRELGLDYVITQHPADKADLSAYNVASKSVYDLLDEGTILISRFSTTMLEALAIGRPVVYHNPIKEKVPKFSQPLGAYTISDSVESLKEALQRELDFIDKGGDVRTRAALFLHFHCNSGAKEEPEELAAKAIFEVLSQTQRRFAFKLGQPQQIVQPLISSQIKPPAFLRPEGTMKDDTHSLLREQASCLLLNPMEALQQITGDARLSDGINQALAKLPVDDPLVQHFQRVKAFAQSRAS